MSDAREFCWAHSDDDLFVGGCATRDEAIHEALDSVEEPGEQRWSGVVGAPIDPEDRQFDEHEWDVSDVQVHTVTRIESDKSTTKIFYTTDEGSEERVAAWMSREAWAALADEDHAS